MIQKAESVVPAPPWRLKADTTKAARGAAKQQDAKEARLERKGGECLIGKERPLGGAGHPRQHAPVRAELNAMTMPETTPSPNATPKILSQNSKIKR